MVPDCVEFHDIGHARQLYVEHTQCCVAVLAIDQLAWHFPVRRRHLRGAFCSLFQSSQISSYVAFPPSVWHPGAFITGLLHTFRVLCSSSSWILGIFLSSQVQPTLITYNIYTYLYRTLIGTAIYMYMQEGLIRTVTSYTEVPRVQQSKVGDHCFNGTISGSHLQITVVPVLMAHDIVATLQHTHIHSWSDNDTIMRTVQQYMYVPSTLSMLTKLLVTSNIL